jgi:pimeloyl-ACP methyl ester carboxylesterase
MAFVTSADGTRIAYETIGSGPPLILIDGAMCYRDNGPMRPLAEALKGRFTVHIYDRRGRGESGNTLPYAPEREIEDLEALLGAAGGEAFVYGCSSGGALAMEAASRLPGVRKLMVYEAPFIVDETHEPLPADEGERVLRLVAEGKAGTAVKRFLGFVGVPAMMLAVFPLLVGKAWKKMTAIAPTLSHDYAIVGPFQRGQPLPAGRWPNIGAVLVADGGKSPAWMRNGAASLARNLGAAYRTLPGQTHMVNAKAQAPVITEFFLG